MKTKFLVTLLLSVILLPSFGANAQRKKVGVVLSGGGAKGVAHISALKAIEEAGIPIDIITGTSMGAIVGGLYSIGYDPHTLDSMVRTQNWTQLLSDKVPRSSLSLAEKESSDKYLLTIPLSTDKGISIPSGIVGGTNVYNLLTELTVGFNDSIHFNELPIPFACVAFDMVKGKTYTFESGFLPEAIRASMSIPGAFTPVRIDSMVLVDGGIGNNFPVNVARSMGAELIIGIDVSAPLKNEDQLNNLADMIDQLTSFLGLSEQEKNREMTDLYIHPDISGYTAASFSAPAIDTLLLRGTQAMEQNRDALYAFKEKVGLPENYEPENRPGLDPDRPVEIGEIVFEGLEKISSKPLIRIMEIHEQSTITTKQLRKAQSNLRGSGMFKSVQYRLENEPPYTLVYTLEEAKQNALSFGFRFDTEEMAAILLHASITPGKIGGINLYATGRLSENPYGKIGFETGNTMRTRFSLSYMFRSNNLDLYYRGKKGVNMDFNHHVIDASLANIWLRTFQAEVGIKYEYFQFRSQLSANNFFPTKVRSEGLVSYYFKARFETLDQRYHPTKGVSFQANYNLYTSNFATYKSHAPFSAVSADFFAPLSISSRLAFIPGVFTRILIGNKIAYPQLNYVGGTVAGRYVPQQLPFIGLHHFELFGNAVAGVKADFRARLWTKTYATVRFNYMKSSDELFELLKGEDVFGVGLSLSYRTIVGPLEALLDWSNRDKKLGFYFSLGYYF